MKSTIFALVQVILLAACAQTPASKPADVPVTVASIPDTHSVGSEPTERNPDGTITIYDDAGKYKATTDLRKLSVVKIDGSDVSDPILAVPVVILSRDTGELISPGIWAIFKSDCVKGSGYILTTDTLDNAKGGNVKPISIFDLNDNDHWSSRLAKEICQRGNGI